MTGGGPDGQCDVMLPSDAVRWFARLDPSGSDVWYCRTINDKEQGARSHGPLSAPDAITRLVAIQAAYPTWGVYAAVNAGGQKARDINRIRAVYVDLDGATIDPVWECGYEPHMVVETSPGRYHVYWCVVDCPTWEFNGIQKRLAARFGGDPAVCDLPRVMRVPGFWHRKRDPYLSHITHLTDAPAYAFADLAPLWGLREGEGRNNALVKVAGQARGAGGDMHAVAAAVKGAAARMADPLPEAEVDRILMSAASWPQGAGETKVTGVTLGSDLDFARRVIAHITATEGPVGRYGGGVAVCRDGVWGPLGDAGLARMVGDLCDGVTYATGEGKTTRLRLTAGRCASICRLVYEHVDPIPEPTPGIVCQGTLILPDGGTIPLAPHHGATATACVDVGWDPTAVCPEWDRYIHDLFDGHVGKMATLQEFVGACLTGQAPNYQKGLILTDDGAGGKSTLLEGISLLFPPGTVSSVTPSELGHEFGRERLRGSKVNVITDLASQVVGDDVIKAAITGDPMTARRPYGQPTDIRPIAGWVLATNHNVRSSDTSDGFWRRWMVLETGGRRWTPETPGYRHTADWVRVWRGELAGILRWAVEGAGRLARIGHYTYTGQDVVDEWRTESDTVALYIRDAAHEVWDGRGDVPCDTLYTGYSLWCRQFGYNRVNNLTFGRRLKRLGITRRRTRQGSVYHDPLARTSNA